MSDEIEEIRARNEERRRDAKRCGTHATEYGSFETALTDIDRLLEIIAEKDAEIARLKGPDCRCGWVAPTVPQVCEGFVRETRPCPEMGTCINCEHDEECHV
jgi:hypothetical protein